MMTLSRKFNLSLITGITAILAAAAFYNIHEHKEHLFHELHEKAERIEQRLGVALPGPIWDFSLEIVERLVRSEEADLEVLKIEVTDANGKSMLEDSSDFIEPDEELTWSTPIFYNGDENEKKIAEMTIYMTDAAINEHVSHSIYSNVLSIAIINLVILLLFNLFLRRLVIGPMNQINARLEDIANGDGDLTQTIDYHTNDEFGILTRNVNQFITSIRSTVSRVLSQSQHLENATSHSAASINEMSTQVHSQEKELGSLISALHQMTDASNEIARSALETATLVQESKNSADDGSVRLRDAASANSQLVEGVSAAVGVIEELEQEVDSISSILDIIRNIAEQTNLLALNAAIEAARAGEQGRGFAVVADEVRQLAQRTQDATSKIQTMIELLQEKSRKAVSVMEEGAKATELSQEKTHSASESLSSIVENINKSLLHADQIATAAEEQTTTMGEIDKNVTNIGSSQKELVSSAATNSDLTTECESIVQELNQLMGKFKV